jgi:hypothetical protein
MDKPSARDIRRTVAIDGLATPRSTWERKLSVTPASEATVRRVRWRLLRRLRIRVPRRTSSSSPSADRGELT